MKIIHCADLHLDSKMSANLPAEQSRERRDELLFTFQRMLQYALTNDVSAILIAGDLFDSGHISAKCKNIVMHAIKDYASIDFYYLKGNHDSQDYPAEFDVLPDNLFLFTDSWTSYPVRTRGRKKIVISGAESGAGNADSPGASLSLEEDAFNIVMLHGQKAEYKTGNQKEMIELRSLRNKNIDYLALGHVHQFKRKRLDARGIYCYPGCLEGRGFDECGEHGFVLLTINEDSGACETEFIPFAKRNLYEEAVDISDCLTTAGIEAAVTEQLYQRQYPAGSMLKIILTGQVGLDCEKDCGYLSARFAQDYYYVKVIDQTEIRVDYDAYRLDESLKGQFVRTVSREDLPDEQKARIIKLGLTALSGGEW